MNHRDEVRRGLGDIIAPSLGISAWALGTSVLLALELGLGW